MCKSCRQQCRGVTFDFHCLQFYHDFCDSSSFCKPNLICFFNAGLNRKASFKGFDTWPMTIIKAVEGDTPIPILVTSSSEHEAPLDLLRIQEICGEQLKVIQEPTRNPFMSKKPERNFMSDDQVPLTFKNFSYFVVRKADLSD